jgi:hypothetical protein
MAARTRSEIKTLVESYTGRTLDTLESSLCDNALKFALQRHPFKEARSSPTDIVIVEDTTESDLSGITDLVSIVTARIVETSGSRNKILKLKTNNWWDKYIRNAEDNLKGWPIYGMRWRSTLLYDRPADAGRSLRLRVTTVQSFASDATVCPIAELDMFVEAFVTAGIFAKLENWTSAKEWRRRALGIKYDINGEIGGELADAINLDSIGDTALDIESEPPDDVAAMDYPGGGRGLSIVNNITGHDDYGNTRWWY